ncbi:MAG: CHAT domain-containing protein, partial [Myxococcota bacterium]
GDAFNLMERMRARDLLDIARMAQVRTSTAQLDTREQAWRQKLQTLAQRQRDLLETPVPARSDLRAEISRLEREAARLRDEVWAESLAGRIGLPDYARLEGVQAALAADEAMLLYQIGETQKFWGERGGGAWAVVVTSTSVSVHEVPDRRALLAPMTIFDGLFDGHDELIEKPAKHLYQALVAQPIAAMPSRVKKLIIVPDGDLHRLPFAALMTAHGRPLGLDFAISFSPSATVWLDKRRAGLSQAQSLPAIVMADPRRQNRQTQVADRGVLDMVAEPGALPFAQKEGRTIMQMLGEGSQLRSGVDASEASFKADLNAPYRVVHFAAHAIVDDVAPERSALWLSTGSRNEDGLLQAREVMGLDLSNRIVVLASCRSASGRIDSAEGIMSLSRAFLAAGATAVVGSRWRLNDRHGLFLSKALYTHLSRGASVVEALRHARISAYDAGLPARAWASLNVQGDGGAIPFPDGSPAYRRAWSMRMAGLMGLLLVGVVGIRFWWRHRRRYVEQ